jgi:hypothetical protein
MPIQGAMRFFRNEYEALIPKESLAKRIFTTLPIAGTAR